MVSEVAPRVRSSDFLFISFHFISFHSFYSIYLLFPLTSIGVLRIARHSVELEEVKQELRESREQLAKSKSAAEGPRGSSAAHFRQTQGFDNFEALRKTEMSREVSEKEKGKVSELSKVSSRRSSKSMDSVERKKGGAAKALLRSKREREAIPQVEAGAIIEMLEDHEEDGVSFRMI